jgi:branched-chain amino acid aminotransferase
MESPPLWGGGVAYQPTQLSTEVGANNLNWTELGFDYIPTNGHVRHTWKDGRWDEGVFVREPYVNVHILANVFHYGQALFEGFKAYHTKAGDVSTFLMAKSLKRMEHGTKRFMMPAPSAAMYKHAVEEVVRQNVGFVPPYGSGGALYVRPFIFGSGPKLGLGPSPEYHFCVFCNPVGSYYKAGKMQALDCLVNDEYDRAAPLGSGDCKAAGNYAADLESMVAAKKKGFAISLYLDSKERKYVEEFNTSNFVAITKDGKYLTPDAPRSVLWSTTNSALRQIARDMGMTVEVRPIDFEAEVDNFQEVGAVGTAVVVTPIKSFTRGERKWEMGEPKVLQELHDRVRGIQQGDLPDTHGWMNPVTLFDESSRKLLSVYPPL